MDSKLFKEGGPHNIKRVGRDKYEMSLRIPTDPDGLTARECPSHSCSPAYFKVKFGTGITDGQTVAYCPYCAHKGEPSDFHTKAQLRYAKDVVTREAKDGIQRMFKNAFGLGPSGKRSIGGGLFSIEMSYKPGHNPPVRPPYEEVLRRDITCPHCKLEHAVFGIATWCPDCGSDIFLEHVSKEYDVLKKMLDDVDNRRERLGSRVAARDVENTLEDTVSIFEAVLRAMTRRKLLQSATSGDIEDILTRRVGNKYQNIELGSQVAEKELNVSLFASLNENELRFLKLTFEKRHPIPTISELLIESIWNALNQVNYMAEKFA